MYPFFLSLHSFGRWLVLISLSCSIIVAFTGFKQRRKFNAAANAWRHWTATIAQLQLLTGMFLYFQSGVVSNPMPDDSYHVFNEHVYFRYIHIALMFVAVIVITIGSAKAKRSQGDRAKFHTMLVWFAAALLILLVAIPWPFSPFAGRPFLRSY